MEQLATKTAGDLALQGSGWALAMLFGSIIVILFKLLRENEKELRMALAQNATLAESSKATNAATAQVLEKQNATISSVVKASETLSREIEGLEREVRHDIASVQTSVNAIAGRLSQPGVLAQ